MIDKRSGPYEVIAKLGEGGIGEVYRATGTGLQRVVAIMLSFVAFTDNRKRQARQRARESRIMEAMLGIRMLGVEGGLDRGRHGACGCRPREPGS